MGRKRPTIWEIKRAEKIDLKLRKAVFSHAQALTDSSARLGTKLFLTRTNILTHFLFVGQNVRR